jgi:predicted nucleotidyltransferase
MKARGRHGGDERRFATQVIRLLADQQAIRSVRLVGSRAEGRATPLSDWDFAVDTHDFESAAVVLPRLIRSLSPLGTFWDPLSRRQCFSAILPGARKVDFIFQEPHRPKPPYTAGADALASMDVHFWDWAIWLAAKEAGHHRELVTKELQKMHKYLLRPLGVPRAPATLLEATQAYLSARSGAERRFRTQVDRRLSEECIRFLVDAGYQIQT